MAKVKKKTAKKKSSVKKQAKTRKTAKKPKREKKTSARKTMQGVRKKTRVEKLVTTEVMQETSVETPTVEVQKGDQNPAGQQRYSKEELEHFKQILLKKRDEILEMLEAHKQSLIESASQNDKPATTPYSIHMEYGTETEEREKTMFFIAREEKMLNYIDAALMRIERGTYGVCVSCGQLIDKRRLEAVPHTQLCIKCKLEQKKRMR